MVMNATHNWKRGIVTALIAICAIAAILSVPHVRSLVTRLTGEEAPIAEASSGGTLTYHQIAFEQDGEGSVLITPPGTTIVMPSNYTFVNGSTVTLQAIPATDYEFDHWEGAITGTENPKQVIVNSAFTCRPVFLPVIKFSVATSSKSENEASATITLTRRPALRTSTVQFIPSGTANGFDYTLNTSSPVTFPSLSTSQTINLSIANDTKDEENEAVVLTLLSPTNARIGLPNPHTLTINDDDPLPTVRFAATGSPATEGGANPTVTLNLSPVSGRTVTVPFTITTLGANGSDYSFSPAEVQINPGSTSVNVPITLTNDTVVEGQESITLTISPSLSNAQIDLSLSTHTITITDNDYTLTTSAVESEWGTLSPSGGTYNNGSEVIVTASPASGYGLHHWEGSGIGAGLTRTVTMNGDQSVTAHFKPIRTLKLTIAPSGQTPVPGTTNPAAGLHSFIDGLQVSIGATESPGWNFEYWVDSDTGNIVSENQSTVVNMTQNRWYVALFVREHTLTTAVLPAGSGIVDPAGQTTYEHNDSVFLTATPSSHWRFDHWIDNAQPGTPIVTNPLEFNIVEDKSFTAHFVEQCVLTINPLNGFVISTPALQGSSPYVLDKGTSLTLQAWPHTGYLFSFWLILEDGIYEGYTYENAIYTFTLGSSRTVIPIFARAITVAPPKYPVDSGWIHVWPEGQGVNGDVYREGSFVDLEAEAASGYVFHQWGDGSTTNPRLHVQVTENIGAVAAAYFLPILPEAEFSAEPIKGFAPLEVTFTDQSIGNATDIWQWEWAFGDGPPQTYNESPGSFNHTYTQPGEYDVSLTVRNDGGEHTVSKTIVVLSRLATHWPFDVQDIEAVDIGPDELNLALTNATQVASGILGSALQVSSGTGQTAEYDVQGSASLFDMTDQATFMTWFKLAGTGADQTVLSKRDPMDDTTGYEVVVNPAGHANTVTLRYGDGNSIEEVISAPSNFEVGEWYHLAVVFDAGIVTFYINRNQVGASISNLLDHFEPNVENFKVGADYANANHFVGLLDEVILHRVALTEDEIEAEFARVVHTFTDVSNTERGSINITPPTNGSVYFHGETITIDAVPASADWLFNEWGGADAADVGDPDEDGINATIAMNGSKSVAALFERAPEAIFHYTIDTNDKLKVNFTDESLTDPPGQPLTWLWNFGDGATSTEQAPSHTYEVDGPHTVTLLVKLQDGRAEDSISQTISLVGKPKAAIDVKVTPTENDLFTVTLTDVSVPGLGQTINAAERAWNFNNGGGGSASQLVRGPLSSGSYPVTLRVEQSDGQEDTVLISVVIEAGPRATFSAVPAVTHAKQYVTFSDTSTAGDTPIKRWGWNFGDGATATGQGPHRHAYLNPGDYEVTLTVQTEIGINTSPPVLITVQDQQSNEEYPDVEVQSIGGVTTGQQFKMNDPIDVSYAVINHSAPTVECPANRNDVLYLSQDTERDVDDLVLSEFNASPSLAGGATQNLSFNSATLADIAPGTYYLIVSLDDDGDIPEYDETNNTKTVAITVVDSEMSND
ncbi:MAG: PKD domain-containing protein [Candidatus Hydrogenedentes bacterium]|nr:PKD domain-containing protein [Candidatus Hydrogenedentota bacterium]